MFKRVIKEEYKVAADIHHLGEMRDFVARVGRKYGVSERIINVFKLAIDEAGTNIIRHAYRDWEGLITIRMAVRRKNITISMIDQGHSFNPNTVKDPDLQRYVDIGKKGGLGIFIIRRVIDHIDYRKTAEGNELRLTKNRDVVQRKRLVMPEVSFTMKTRFSLIASGILTSIVMTGFVWNYLQQEKEIFQNRLTEGRTIARTIVPQYIDQLEKLEPYELQNWELPWELATISAEFQREYEPLVTEVLIVDSSGIIQSAVGTELILVPYKRPLNAVERARNVYEYQTDQGRLVYDIVEGATLTIANKPRNVGTVHLLLDKTVVDGNVKMARQKVILNFGLVLLFGYLGVFLLVYITMSPFKKLLQWIRALGRDEIHEEMEFDSSDEVGQIAQAFNDITEKFRKSQENLAERERLQKEMQVAQEIQHMLLPSTFPEIEGYEIASYYEAAKEVGGDYFDFVDVDKDTLGIVVADVSGKGVPGSLIMTMIRTALRTEAKGNKNAADVLARVNDFVINDMKRGMFVTVFYIILDSRHRTINYASAGHNPMILYRGKTKKSFYLNPRGFPIGINLPDNTLFRRSIQSDTLRFREDDTLIIYTDGVTEAMNQRRDKFGDERLLSTIRNYGHFQVDPLVDKIRNEINSFSEGYAQSDDITLVAVKEKLKAEDVLFNLRTRLMKMVSEEGLSIKEACKNMGVSPSTYYKYNKRFKKMGLNGLKEKVTWSDIEEKHISIEDKVKIYDIIKEHPEYGAKRICEELNTPKYSNTIVDDKRIYDELVRSRLNTKELRSAFIEKGGRKKRMKPPGTPFLSLDGQIIVPDRLTIDKKASFISGEKTKEEMLEMKASRRPMKEMDIKKEPIEEEKMSPVFDELLQFPEESENKADDSHAQLDRDQGDIEGVPSLSVGFSELEMRGDDREEKEQEIGLSSVTGENKESEGEPIFGDSGSDESFDEFIVDMDHVEDEEISDSAEVADFGSVLEIEEQGISEGEDIGHIEDNITTSVAGELLGEEIGEKEDQVEKKDTGFYQHEEAFLEMMEGVGFDRRTVLSGDRESPKKKVQESRSDLSKKRFLESGLWFYRQGLFAKAINELKKAIKEDPAYVEAYQCLGDTFFRLGEFDSAKNAYEKVKRLDPNNENVLENLGVIFANSGDYKRAVWQWGEVLKNNPDRKDIVDRIKKIQRVIRQRCL